MNEFDYQSLLSTSSLLITDYSSVFFDFAYLKKPIIYSQFDYDEYRKNHYKKGYFDYRKDGFGDVVVNEADVIKCVFDSYNNDFKLKPTFEKKHDDFFQLYDNKNNERIYEEINKI